VIVPGAIPQIPGDMDVVITSAVTLTAAAEHYAATGASVATTWQGLAPVYRAPEDAQLLAAMQPVMSKSADVHTSVSAAAAALSTYGNTVRPIKQRLAALQVEATAFVGSVAGDGSWTKDQGKVDHNNNMLEEVDRLIVAWQDAQRACANSIDALYPGGVQYTVTTDGKSANQYGYTTDQLSSALHSDHGVPWGKTDTHDPGAFASALNWVGNALNPINQLEGAWKSIKGLGTGLWTLVGGNGLDQAGQAWKGLGELGLALTPGMLALNSVTALPGIKQGELGSTLTNAGKSLIAWDDWKTNPGQAAGEVGVNIGTFFIPGAGEVAGGTKTAAGVAGDLAKASKAAVVAKVADLGAGLSAGAKVLPGVLRDSLPGLKLPAAVSTGGLKLDIASVDAGKAAPRLHLPNPAGTGPTEAERVLLPTHGTDGAPAHPATGADGAPAHPTTGHDGAPAHPHPAGDASVAPHPTNGSPATLPINTSHLPTAGQTRIEQLVQQLNLSNGEKGRLGEALSREAIVSHPNLDIVGEQIKYHTNTGQNVVADFVVRDQDTGQLFVVESKYGGSRLTPNQSQVFPQFDAGPQKVEFNYQSQVDNMQQALGSETLPTTIDQIQVMRWEGPGNSRGFSPADFEAVKTQLATAQGPLTSVQKSLLVKLQGIKVPVGAP